MKKTLLLLVVCTQPLWAQGPEPLSLRDAALVMQAYDKTITQFDHKPYHVILWKSIAPTVIAALFDKETKQPHESRRPLSSNASKALELLLASTQDTDLPIEVTYALQTLQSLYFDTKTKGGMGNQQSFYISALKDFVKKSSIKRQQSNRLTKTAYKKQQQAKRERRLLERQEERLKRHVNKKELRSAYHKDKQHELARKEYAKESKALQNQHYKARKAANAKTHSLNQQAQERIKQREEHAAAHIIGRDALLKNGSKSKNA
jgi:hypothetical protein